MQYLVKQCIVGLHTFTLQCCTTQQNSQQNTVKNEVKIVKHYSNLKCCVYYVKRYIQHLQRNVKGELLETLHKNFVVR